MEVSDIALDSFSGRAHGWFDWDATAKRSAFNPNCLQRPIRVSDAFAPADSQATVTKLGFAIGARETFVHWRVSISASPRVDMFIANWDPQHCHLGCNVSTPSIALRIYPARTSRGFVDTLGHRWDKPTNYSARLAWPLGWSHVRKPEMQRAECDLFGTVTTRACLNFRVRERLLHLFVAEAGSAPEDRPDVRWSIYVVYIADDRFDSCDLFQRSVILRETD